MTGAPGTSGLHLRPRHEVVEARAAARGARRGSIGPLRGPQAPARRAGAARSARSFQRLAVEARVLGAGVLRRVPGPRPAADWAVVGPAGAGRGGRAADDGV